MTDNTDPVEIVKRLVDAGEKASIGPMAYRPRKNDDWGFVRDSTGGLILSTSNAWMSQDYSDVTPWPERQEGPPLVNANGRFVVEAFNARPAIAALLEDVQRLRGDSDALAKASSAIVDRLNHRRHAGSLTVEENAAYDALRDALAKVDGNP